VRIAVTVLFVPRERARGERRVAATPDSVRRLSSDDLEVVIETGAGDRAGASDDDYVEAGARIHDGTSAPTGTDVVARVAPPTRDEVEQLPEGVTLLSLIAPHRNQDSVRALAERRVTTIAMELVPRISRAQSMDALSSQASIAGYRAVIVAANESAKLFPLFMTAAGTIRPANVVVLGAGVAGLQAVATARRLGALVYVSDIREAAREEVASLGGKFIEVPDTEDLTGEGGYAKEAGDDFLARQRAVLTEHLSTAHAVITTAQIPGRRAPELVTAAMVEAMQPGSVVIDLAAADGGNCALTDADAVVEHHGVRILPGQHLPSDMATEASALYARNITAFLALLLGDGGLHLDRDDEVVAGALLTHDGEVTHPPTATLLGGGA
jgi:H+-translocating NAD(P) transhydrogenase subunit alpha